MVYVYEDFLMNGWYATCKRNIFLNKAIRERNGKSKKRYSNSFSLSVTYEITATSIYCIWFLKNCIIGYTRCYFVLFKNGKGDSCIEFSGDLKSGTFIIHV